MTRLYKLVCIVDHWIDDSTADMTMLSTTAVTAAGRAMSQGLLLLYYTSVRQCITVYDGVTQPRTTCFGVKSHVALRMPLSSSFPVT